MMKRPYDEYDLVEYIAAPPMALSLHWKDHKIIEMRTRWAKSITVSVDLTAEARQLEKALARYVSGETPDWPELPLDFSHLTDFQQTVLDELYRVPSGTTCTYGELAALIGNPNGARAIGMAMGRNPFPMLYP